MTSQHKNEEREEKRHQTLASVSFVAVLIIIGLPLWWKTTEVYRVSLPYDEIAELERTPLSVSAEVTVWAYDEPTAEEVAGLLRELLGSDVLKVKVGWRVLPNDLRDALSSFADEEDAVEAALEQVGDTPGHVHVVQRDRLAGDVWLGGERVLLFRDARAGATVAEVLRQWVYREGALSSALVARGGGGRAPFPPSAHYDIVLSVIHSAPEQYQLNFPTDAFEDYIGSFVDELGSLHNFTLKSQWLHFLHLDFEAEKRGSHYAVRASRLPHLLSPLEKRAGARVAPAPAVRLVLYAVPCELAPLAIYDDRDSDLPVAGPLSGFLSPRWGGVVLASPPEKSCRDKGIPFEPDVAEVMGLFVAQLRELLGIEKLPHIEGASLAPLRSVAPRRWEVDGARRVRTLEQLTSAVLTLSSIAQLLGKISNIVINDEVGASIGAAARDAAAAAAASRAGQSERAYELSVAAARDAEYAFTSPSLLALLYFPDDQKYAVYIPLFLPIMIPVVLSVKNIIPGLKRKSEKPKVD